MRNLFFLLFFATASTAFSQKITDTIDSQRMRERREITISLPASYNKEKSKKYPILIVLDGDYLSSPFEGALTYGAYWDDMPETIIVGISQNKKNEREADCTVDRFTGLPEKKGEVFYEFIETELLPYIQTNYRTGSFKMIAGHDLTAGFLNFFLYKDQSLFNAYISLSPEFPFAMEDIIPLRLSILTQSLFYYQSSADGDIKKMQEKIRKLDQDIKAVKLPNVNYRFDEFKQTSHYSLVLYSIPNALAQIFSIYPPISVAEFNEKIAPLPSGYVNYLSNKYKTIEDILEMKIPIRINDFNAIEAAIMKNKAYDELEELSKLARSNYPKSMMADYEIALMYDKKGDNKKAEKYYMDAFQKEEIGRLTRTMMHDRAKELKATFAKKEKVRVKATDLGSEEEDAEEPAKESTTEEPATDVPVTDVPAAEVPAADIPATEVPNTEAPAPAVPATEVPATEVPATEVPAAVPATEVPSGEVPAGEAPTEPIKEEPKP